MHPRSRAIDLVRRLVAWSSTPAGLASLFGVGLLIRLALLGGGGFPYDMSSFAAWAGRLAERGPWNFYPRGSESFFVDYPPGYLYVLWGLGRLTRAISGTVPSVAWLKLPPLLADLGLAWLVGTLASRLAPSGLGRRAFNVRGPAAAAILLNPAIFFVSSVWGQVDVFLAVLVVAALLMLATGPATFRREAAGIALLAVAVGTKPQGAFALPMVVLFLVWRHLREQLAEDREGIPKSTILAGGLGRIAALAGIGGVAGLALLAPFRLGPAGAIDFYAKASGTYKVTSVFAFNTWGVVGFWRPDSGSDSFRFIGLPAFVWGLLLFSVGGALVLRRAWGSLRSGVPEARVLVFGCAALTLVGFASLTRIHERYLFLPVALLAVFIGHAWLRRAFIAMSALYLINVFFPYQYYVKFVGREAPSLGGLVQGFYGSDTNGTQLRVLSALITLACIVIAARGWRALERTPEAAGELEPDAAAEPPVQRVRPPWSLRLHPVGRRGALVAFIAFGVALLIRLPALGHPPGMYFDEVYHARTGAEYLAGKEVFEWTHPPLAKEIIALSIKHLSGFGVRDGGALPSGVGPDAIASGKHGMVWAASSGRTTTVQSGRLDASCGLERDRTLGSVALSPSSIGVDDGPVFVTGMDGSEPVIVRLDDRSERTRTVLPDLGDKIAVLGDRAFVLTVTGELVFVGADGAARTISRGVGDIVAEPRGDPQRTESSASDRVPEALPKAPSREGIVWASLPADDEVVAYDADGRKATTIDVPGGPFHLTAPDNTERLFVATQSRLTVLDSKKTDIAHRLDTGADRLASVPDTEIAWAGNGVNFDAIEPRSGAVIGGVTLDPPPAALVADPDGHRLVAVNADGLRCASGRPQFAWRLGSAVMGSVMVALLALLALRLFGNVWIAGLAALFLAVDGLAFTMSRIAIPESYTTAFLLAAWFCVLSAMYRWGSGAAERSRAATIGWLAATGLSIGLAGASKWVAVYGFGAICLFVLWDAFRRGPDSIWRVAGGPTPSVVVIGACLGLIPLAVYVLTYIPYFSLGHSAAELFRLQGQMFGYHSNLDATHPFSSPWYGWPLGYKAVFLYLSNGDGGARSEIWTIPNLVVFWGGIVAFAAMVRRARDTRSAALGVVVFAAVVQLLPWAAVGRVVFLYHYLPVVPFLALGLGWLLVEGLKDAKRRAAIAATTAVVAVLFFCAVFPMLVGWSMSSGYLQAVRDALFWVIP